MGQSQFGDAPESQAQPVNLLGSGVELALDAPTHSTKRDGVALMIPGATGELTVSTANPLPVSVIAGGGGGGDASAANQTTQIGLETTIRDNTNNLIPGQDTMANSIPVVIASNQTPVPVSASSLPLPTGATTEATLSSINTKTLAAGQAVMASSSPVVIASDQSAVPISAASLPLPSGAATEATLAAANAKLPAALGQTTMAASLSVAIASNQSAIPVSQSGTWNITNVSGTVSLPTGAATSAAQTTAQTSLDLIDDVPTAANGAFSRGNPMMGQLDDTGTTAATENNCMPIRITAQRSLHVNLRDTNGAAAGIATNGVVISGRGSIATTPGGGTESEAVPIFCDSQGRVVTRPHSTPDKLTQNLITLTNTTETTLIAAGGATLFRDLTMLMLSNTSASGVRVDIRDATSGTVRLSWWLAGGASTGNLIENSQWKQTTANNNWTAQLSGSVTDVRVMAQGVERPTATF